MYFDVWCPGIQAPGPEWLGDIWSGAKCEASENVRTNGELFGSKGPARIDTSVVTVGISVVVADANYVSRDSATLQ
ncbi:MULTISPECIES: hypothetical protein [unclassified Dietzia]|uniref:hypothetical protein n=1 Tax=unclassified Dietzia TaxID=2617939 RepID=UPI0015F836FF|nr:MULTISPECIES: hypothetical protein [unclassified Dietzia]